MQVVVIGIDLAWSPKNLTGLAVATVTQDEVRVVATATAKTNGDIIEFIRPYTDGALTIAIDAPTGLGGVRCDVVKIDALAEELLEQPIKRGHEDTESFPTLLSSRYRLKPLYGRGLVGMAGFEPTTP